MKEFIKAAKDDDNIVDDGEKTTFPHWGRDVTFYQPSDGQQLMMLAMGGRGMSKEAAGRFIQLFIELGDDDTQQYFHDLMMDRNSGFDLKSEGGLFDVWEALMEEWSGKDSEKPSASRNSPSATGKGSTAPSRRRASTSSVSRSTRS